MLITRKKVKKDNKVPTRVDLEILARKAFDAANIASCNPPSAFIKAGELYSELLEQTLRCPEATKADVKFARKMKKKLLLRTCGILDLRGLGMGLWQNGKPYEPQTQQQGGDMKKEVATAPAAKPKLKKLAPTPNQASGKKVAKKDVKPAKVGRPVGKTTGLKIKEYWVHLFEQNGKARVAMRMTDDAISKAVKKEFPGRDSKVFDNVRWVRGVYNKGGLTNGVVPSKLSVGYDVDGNEVSAGARTKKADAVKPKKAEVKKLVKTTTKKPKPELKRRTSRPRPE